MKRFAVGLVCWLALAATSRAQTTRPAATTQPSGNDTMSMDQRLSQMLQQGSGDEAKALPASSEGPATDVKSGKGAVAPSAPSQNLLREGTYLFDRVGRMVKTGDGRQQFVFDSDGKAMKDPPMLLLPNLKLMQMEDAVNSVNADRKFRISGTVTEYRGRNYILVDKLLVEDDKQ